jgi:hypothetical protein
MLYGLESPYKTLALDEKFNIMMNYFLTKELEAKLPLYPKKKILKDDGASLDPVKYEFYFSYIQRIKRIREAREEDQKKIDEIYAGQVAFYNSKVDILFKYYSKEENIYPLLYNSINKAFKVIYGKPILKNVRYSRKYKQLVGTLHIEPLYNIEMIPDTNIKIKIRKNKQINFLKQYNDYKILIEFVKNNNILKFKNIILQNKQNEYNGFFIENSYIDSLELRLNIKPNKSVFNKIKLQLKKIK